MKLLILTQKVDTDDSILGFFHRWILEFAKHCEKITVICLMEGKHNLPANVKVLSLGKERGASRLKYLWNFYLYIWQERKNYDVVFVHMNQEYVILGWKFWKLWGKKIWLWRNHPKGSWLTRWAVFVSNRVFCTSKFSFTARFKKTELMPVGIDTDLFNRQPNVFRQPKSILFLARMSPIKKPDLLIRGLSIIKERQVSFSAKLIGSPSNGSVEYYHKLKSLVDSLGLGSSVEFLPEVKNYETPIIYSQHLINVNLTPAGSYDKTIFEAMACGCLTLCSNRNLLGEIDHRLIFLEDNLEDLASKLQLLLELSNNEIDHLTRSCRDYVVSVHSLKLLAEKLFLHL